MNVLRVLGAVVMGAMIVGCQPSADKNREAGLAEGSANSELGDRLQVVARGKNKEMSYKAPHAGLLYVYDPQADQFIYKGRLAAGEQFVFDPAGNYARIDKQTVDLDHVTNERDEYKVFFVER